jgi:hypothetical protein
MIYWLPNLIFAQLFLVLVLAAYTFLLLLFRRFRDERHRAIIEKYHAILTDEMIALSTPPNETPSSLVQLWKTKALNRPLFLEALLAQMKMVNGEEHALLLRLYEELNFKKDDIRNCESMFWSNRLNSVLHLGALAQNQLAPLFHDMIFDSDAMVSVAALLSLSKLKHPLNSPYLIRQIPDHLIERSNVLYEFIANMGLQHGVDPLIWAICHHPSPRVAHVSIRALRIVRSLEAVGALNSLLRQSTQMLSPTVLREIIATLSMIGDPSSLPVVRKFLRDPIVSIRAESALFLLNFYDAESMPLLKEMRSDPNVVIKRMFQVFDAQQADQAMGDAR